MGRPEKTREIAEALAMVRLIVKNAVALRDLVIKVKISNQSAVELGVAAVIAVGGTLAVASLGFQRFPVGFGPIGALLPIVMPGPTTKQEPSSGGADGGTSIEILQATLLRDGELEIRGAVHSMGLGHSQTAQAYLRTLEVKVTLSDKAEGSGMIDTNLCTWRVRLNPSGPFKAGDRLNVEVVLLGEGGHRTLYRTRQEIFVEALGSPS